MNEPNNELPAGSTLSHYHIVSRIGAGGMVEVYLAEDAQLGRRVAITHSQNIIHRDIKPPKIMSPRVVGVEGPK